MNEETTRPIEPFDEAELERAAPAPFEGAGPQLGAAPLAPALTPARADEAGSPITLGVGDGFRFGCGLILAGLIAVLAGAVLLAAVALIATLLGVGVPQVG